MISFSPGLKAQRIPFPHQCVLKSPRFDLAENVEKNSQRFRAVLSRPH